MALQKTITLASGLQAPDAYIRIDTVSGYKGSIAISVNSYANQQAFADNKPYLEQRCTISLRL